jgi:hypothetical protein
MGRLRIIILIGSGILGSGLAHTQMRAGQPPTLSPPAAPALQVPDAVGPFRSQYRAAGSPRIVLFWNVSFDDTTESPRADVTVRGAEVYPFVSKGDGNELLALGVRAHASGYLDPAKRGSGSLSESDLAQLDSAFRNELLAANVRILDRATTIRFMEAQRDRTGVDPKLIEADAVLGRADILLQVLLVPDADSPLDTGFNVSAVRVKTGAEIASLYTLALPNLSAAPGHYIATDSGFVWEQPPTPTPDAGEIGIKLADEVMEKLGPMLITRQQARTRRAGSTNPKRAGTNKRGGSP